MTWRRNMARELKECGRNLETARRWAEDLQQWRTLTEAPWATLSTLGPEWVCEYKWQDPKPMRLHSVASSCHLSHVTFVLLVQAPFWRGGYSIRLASICVWFEVQKLYCSFWISLYAEKCFGALHVDFSMKMKGWNRSCEQHWSNDGSLYCLLWKCERFVT